LRARDWSDSPLGPPEGWPAALKAACALCLASPAPLMILAGSRIDEVVQIYNDAVAKMVGARHPAALGAVMREMWPDRWDSIAATYAPVLAGQAVLREGHRVVIDRHGYPEPLWFTDAHSPIRGEDGEIVGVLSVLMETTHERSVADRLAFESALSDELRGLDDPDAVAAAATRLLGEHLAAARCGFGPVDPTTGRMGVAQEWTNGRAAGRAHGYGFQTPNPEVAAACREGRLVRLAPPDPGAQESARPAGPDRSSPSIGLVAPLLRDGEWVAALWLRAGEPRRWTADEEETVRFVAERTWAAVERAGAEQRLRESEARLRDSESWLRFAQAAGQIGAFELLPRQGLILVSDSYCQLWGLPPQPQVKIDEVFALVHPDDRDALKAPRGDTGQLDYQEYRIRRADTGEERWIARRGEVIRDESGRKRYLGVAYDISTRKRAEEALRALNERLETEVADRTAERDRMWRLSAELMLVGDLNANIAALNPAWESVLGWSPGELDGPGLMALVHPEDRELSLREMGRLRQGAAVVRYENRFRARDGSYRRIAWTATPEGGFFHALGRDITEERAAAEALRRTEEELRQAQKMEAVGQLTGGIAHDFNNMLAIVIGSLDLAQRRIERGDAAGRYIDAAREGALRAAGLTQRLLAFSRRQPLSPKIVNLNRLVGEMSELLSRTLGEPVTLETVLAGGLWPVRVDPHQMESALVNLAVNARDAMPDGGRLTVRTANLSAQAAMASGQPGLEAQDYVTISVADRGAGMTPDVLERVFEPFFTTKAVGKGTGLGLSMVYGFVRQSGGEVAIVSEPGEGTTVTIYLPRRAGAEADIEAGAPAASPRAAGGEVVLVVEDEDEVRQMSVEALTELGYQVCSAAGGEAALQVMAGLPRLDLLFTDVVMPGMTGRQLAETARARAPGLKVLYTTGYTPDSVVHDGVMDEGVELLPKPFSISELADKVRAVLDG